MTATINEIDIMELIDWEEAVPCESIHGCDAEAEWFYSIPCGCEYKLCTPCKEGVEEFIKAWTWVHCPEHNRDIYPHENYFRRI